jgi:hypothetical protein
MNKVNNERGATLLISLLLILLVVILTTSLATLAVTTLKQAQKMEDNLELTNLAEMGVVYYHKKLNSFIANEKFETVDEFIELWSENNFDEVKVVEIDNVDGVHSFKVKALIEEINEEKLIISIKSTGMKKSTNASKEIVSLLAFTNNNNNKNEKGDPPTVTIVTEEPSTPNNTFTNKIIRSNESIKEEGDYLFKPTGSGNVFTMESGAELEINGKVAFKQQIKSATFRGNIEFKDSVNMIHQPNHMINFNIFNNGTSSDEDEDAIDTTVTFKDIYYADLNSIAQDSKTEWLIKKSAYFDVNDQMYINGILTIKEDAYFESTSTNFNVGPNGKIIIEKNASFINNSFSTAIIEGYIHIENDAIFHENDKELLGTIIIETDKLPDDVAERKGKVFVKQAFFNNDNTVYSDGLGWKKDDISTILYDKYDINRDYVEYLEKKEKNDDDENN